MPIIHLVRHGATATSGQCYAGRADVPLTPEGHIQAATLAETLCRRPITAILSSPLQRARDTALPLAERLGLEIAVDPDLVEFDFGDLEGRPKAGVALNLRKHHLTDPVPGGEALSDLWLRIGHVAERLLRFEAVAEVIVVGHHWTNRLLVGRLQGRSLAEAARARDYRPAPGSVHTIEPPVETPATRCGKPGPARRQSA